MSRRCVSSKPRRTTARLRPRAVLKAASFTPASPCRRSAWSIGATRPRRHASSASSACASQDVRWTRRSRADQSPPPIVADRSSWLGCSPRIAPRTRAWPRSSVSIASRAEMEATSSPDASSGVGGWRRPRAVRPPKPSLSIVRQGHPRTKCRATRSPGTAPSTTTGRPPGSRLAGWPICRVGPDECAIDRRPRSREARARTTRCGGARRFDR